MKSIIKIFSIFLIAALVLPLSAYAQKSEISASVVDENGNPVKDAKVFSDDGAKMARTDATGAFTLAVDPSGSLVVEAEGYESQSISIADVMNGKVTLTKMPFHLGEGDVVNMPFDKVKKRLIPGAVTSLDAADLVLYDTKQSVYGALNGRVPGQFGNLNVRGLGSALIVVDGIPRPADVINLQEVEQITVLRDLGSRMLYGAQADQGVILVTTKRGTPYRRTLNVTAETGIQSPISYPEFLGSADYMELYNEALANDGEEARFSSKDINDARSGSNPLLAPNQDYFNSTFLNDNASFHKIIAEAGGGNEAAQYYLNLGWNQSNSLLKLGEGADAGTNRINLRGNVDYKLNDWLRASLDGVALFDISTGPRYSGDDFWGLAASLRPNEFPALIPASAVKDSAILNSASFFEGDQLIGGTSEFTNNIYGELSSNGYRNTTRRIIQINSGLDFDLKGITEGLKAKAYLSFDLDNLFITQQNNSYAVYEPVVADDGSISFNKIGVDEKRDDQAIGNVDFARRIGFYGTLNYNRTFNEDHTIWATGLAYRDELFLENEIQSMKHLHFGLNANYAYQNRYIIGVNGILAGSPLFAGSNQYAFSPGISAAWVISEEDFMSANSLFDYLKLRAGWALNQTDGNTPGYFLYETSYVDGGWYNYFNGVNRNRAQNITLGNPDLGWQKRQEINIGLEAMLFDNHVWLEAGYFHSKSYDEIIQRENFYPGVISGFIPYENYNSYLDQGVELGLSFINKPSGDFSYRIGLNGVYSMPEVIQIDEPNYTDAYRQKVGQPVDALFGWVADGLYQNETEIENHAVQTFGDVQPGDIKYKDLNGDGIIDDNDQQIIGDGSARLQYGLNVHLKYKNLELFALGTGQTGQESYFNNAYYWVFGDRKYSTQVLNRWTPATANTATYPRLSSRNNPNNFRNSTFWLQKNNWFTLHTAQLTYNLPSSLEWMKEVRIYLRAANIFTISDIKEQRELNIGTVPQMRSYALGLNVAF